MPGTPIEGTRSAGNWVPQVNSAAVESPRPALEGRSVTVEPPQGARNPIVRFAMGVVRLLSRLCSRSQPANARLNQAKERATHGVQQHVWTLFRHLTVKPHSPRSAQSPAATAATAAKAAGKIATDLSNLAAAHQALISSHGKKNDKHAAEIGGGLANADQVLLKTVEEMLDREWPGESALELAHALRSQRVADAQNNLGVADDKVQRLLIAIESHVADVITRRAEATMDRDLAATLDTIRTNALPTDIREHAEKAIQTTQTVITQLRRPKLLLPVGFSGTPRSQNPLEAQTAQMMQSRIAALGASDAELDTLMRNLKPGSLSMLVTKEPGDARVAAAVDKEITARIPRLMREFEQEVVAGGIEGTRQRANTILSSSLDSEIQRIDSLYEEIIDHNVTFGEHLDQPKLRGLLEQLEEQMMALSDAHIRPTGAGSEFAHATRTASKLFGPDAAKPLQEQLKTHIERTKANAKASVLSVLYTLATHGQVDQASAYLLGCKNMVAAVQQYVLATGVTPDELAKPGRLQSELKALINEIPASQRPGTPAMLAAFQTPEMAALPQVLSEAASQAKQRNLPELQTDLSDTCTAMGVIAKALNPGAAESSNAKSMRRTSNTPHFATALQERTRATLAKHFSSAITAEGKIALTANHFEGAFAARIKQSIEAPFSDKENSTQVLPGNIVVPAQFVTDAKRISTTYIGPNGESLIDRTGWEKLTDHQKEERIAALYHKVLQLFEGNEQQTAAILTLANQGTAAGFLEAARFENTSSPLRLEGYPPGVTNRSDMSTDELTTIRFFKGENHHPRMEWSYEIRGGRYDLVAPEGYDVGTTVYLDLNKSRAKFSVTVEADVAQRKLAIQGAPTYDIHLVRSPIQRAFAAPKVADFFLPTSGPLYRAAIEHAEATDPAKVGALRAMQTRHVEVGLVAAAV
jgi:archaellum component FlaC